MTRWEVRHGSMLDLLPLLDAESADSCVCDPPYELGFMGRAWDKSGIAFSPETWSSVLRVLKPGAHLLAFGGTRTAHRIACAIEDAGFDIRDGISWLYGSGFPKSLNVGGGWGTALKPAQEPIIVARKPFKGTVAANIQEHGTGAINIDACRVAHSSAADLAAHEAQVAAIKERGGSMEGSWKNSSDLSGASDVNTAGRWPPNVVLTHSAACRVVGSRTVKANPTWNTPNRDCASTFTGETVSEVRHVSDVVRVYECAPDCPVRELDAQSGEISSGFRAPGTERANVGGFGGPMPAASSGNQADTGTASRFFPQSQWHPALDDVAPFLYAAKASRGERDQGLEGFDAATGGEATSRVDGSPGTQSPRAGAGRKGGSRNIHPTVKPVELLRWLVRLVTPSKGLVLDPFAGSGSCGIASVLEGFRYLGIELNDTEAEPFASIARARIEWVIGAHVTAPSIASTMPKTGQPGQLSLLARMRQ